MSRSEQERALHEKARGWCGRVGICLDVHDGVVLRTSYTIHKQQAYDVNSYLWRSGGVWCGGGSSSHVP